MKLRYKVELSYRAAGHGGPLLLAEPCASFCQHILQVARPKFASHDQTG